MAKLIPGLNSCSSRMTPGERRFAQRLEEKLKDDYLIWYDVPIGRKRLHPDFIILHPNRGILVLEVKDWKLSSILQVNPDTVTLITPERLKEVKNPLRQAREYALAVKNVLEQDTLLVRKNGRYTGNLIFPYGYGVVFSNITRKTFESEPTLSQMLAPNLVICQDEFYESVDALNFQEQLWSMNHYDFGNTLTAAQIDRIRWHLFPELRFIAKQLSLFDVDSLDEQDSSQEIIPDILHIMDLQQEELARSLGEGHRVIHGVAGSGKTMILAYRCQHLAQEITGPILILCFNVSLAARLRHIIQNKGLCDRVNVRHFHGWCIDQLRAYDISRPDLQRYQGEDYIEQIVQQVIESVNAGLISTGKYGAVLVDEGHDFQPEWLKIAAKMVDPETNSLLLLYDDAQNLYGQKHKKQFSFRSLGIQAQGRTTILKLNYRNTVEILAVAYEFAKEAMIPTQDIVEDMPMLIEPTSAGRRGLMPELHSLPSFREETEYLKNRVQQFHERGIMWNEIGIIYRFKFIGEQIYNQLQQAQIPVEWVNANSASRDYKPAAHSIKLMTMHSSKGLEFSVVFIPGLGYLPNQHSTLAMESRLLYVAMTRAISQLVLTCHQNSDFTVKIKSALEKAAVTIF
ncbi:MAG: NERD domain-containing protein [Stigonema ocellatum SAG 48.90 = DSM 106950]|nr:NERD domain-containing protein [Stigonema ocellatum SAG 48.90 = DSM 106950]